MKKTIAIILTVAFLVFGASLGSVQAGDNNGDGLPEYYIPMP